jgi:hypothetical protein
MISRVSSMSASLFTVIRGRTVTSVMRYLPSTFFGYVQQVVQTPAREIEFIVGYSRWWGWFGRPVAVPLEALGIEGGHLVSLDMQPSEYDAAATCHDTGATPLPADATVRVALNKQAAKRSNQQRCGNQLRDQAISLGCDHGS